MDTSKVGLYLSPSTRTDIESGYIFELSTKSIIAFVSWCSKGSYDNEAKMRVVSGVRTFSDDIVESKDVPGKWTKAPLKLTRDQKVEREFVNMLNTYNELQAKGADQPTLDDHAEKIRLFRKEHMSHGAMAKRAERYTFHILKAQTKQERLHSLAYIAQGGCVEWYHHYFDGSDPLGRAKKSSSDEEESKA